MLLLLSLDLKWLNWCWSAGQVHIIYSLGLWGNCNQADPLPCPTPIALKTKQRWSGLLVQPPEAISFHSFYSQTQSHLCKVAKQACDWLAGLWGQGRSLLEGRGWWGAACALNRKQHSYLTEPKSLYGNVMLDSLMTMVFVCTWFFFLQQEGGAPFLKDLALWGSGDTQRKLETWLMPPSYSTYVWKWLTKWQDFEN